MKHNDKVKSYRMPYYIQLYSTISKEWITIRRFANYNKAIAQYITYYEQNKSKERNWRKRPLLRLYDNLYDDVIADHDLMADASMLASWHSPKYLAAMLKAEQRRNAH